MVKCKWCKAKTRTNYYLLKFNGKIIAHFCSLLCLKAWANRKYEEQHTPREAIQSPLLEFYDHTAHPTDVQDDTSLEVIKE